jgi:hypothetical protein
MVNKACNRNRNPEEINWITLSHFLQKINLFLKRTSKWSIIPRSTTDLLVILAQGAMKSLHLIIQILNVSETVSASVTRE